jgi:pyruvate dehydrogenase E2 component (dihydrolipoamide acetyltransferase)
MSDARLAPVPVRLSRIRRTIGRRLRESVTTKPAVTLHTTAPADGLRAEVEDARSRTEPIGITALVAAAAVRSLAQHPGLNGHVSADELLLFPEVHLGVAVDTFAGLVVLVVRDAHTLDAPSIGARIAELAERARAGGLTPEDVLDATFTVSSLGAFGVEAFTPIVNPPQIAVLGIGAIRSRPAVRDGRLVEASVIHLSLTFDHAAVDGAPAARFLADLVARLATPDRSLEETA